MYEPSQIGVPPTEAKTLSDIGNGRIIPDFLIKVKCFLKVLDLCFISCQTGKKGG
jgi:hypothetical protein